MMNLEKIIPKDIVKPDILKDTSNIDKNKDIDKPLKVEEAIKVKCRNEHLEGKTHPENNIEYTRKIVRDADGNLVEVVTPDFNSIFDVRLSEENIQATDKKQFNECNQKLKEATEKDPELKNQFTDEQIEQIQNGDTPDGYTWHHDEEYGKMELVDSDIHAKTGHTGGKAIWGGGSSNR